MFFSRFSSTCSTLATPYLWSRPQCHHRHIIVHLAYFYDILTHESPHQELTNYINSVCFSNICFQYFLLCKWDTNRGCRQLLEKVTNIYQNLWGNRLNAFVEIVFNMNSCRAFLPVAWTSVVWCHVPQLWISHRQTTTQGSLWTYSAIRNTHIQKNNNNFTQCFVTHNPVSASFKC